MKKHDPLALKFLIDVMIAKEFLDIHLPFRIKNICDLNTLTIESGSYIEDDLKSHYYDVVYCLKSKDDDNSIYIYTLIDYQNSASELMPLRILRYQLAIIQKYIDKYGKNSGLPSVIL